MSKQAVTLDEVEIAKPVPPPTPGSALAVTPASLPAPPRLDNRIPITTRLPPETHERLRLLAFQTRRKKQDRIDEALAAYLTAHGV